MKEIESHLSTIVNLIFSPGLSRKGMKMKNLWKILGPPIIDSHFSMQVQSKGGVRSVKLEWMIPVGCDFSGFFVEFLGFLVELVSASSSSFVCKEACL
jgi:hypothetical protein